MKSTRLVFIGGYQVGYSVVNFIASELGRAIQADTTLGLTWYDAVHKPNLVENVSKGAILVTHSMGASVLRDIPNSTNHPAVTATKVVMAMAPTILSLPKYVSRAMNYGKIQEGHPGIKAKIDKISDDRPGIFDKYQVPWGLAQIAKQFFSGRQIDRVNLAYEINQSRGDRQTSILTSEHDQYYPASPVEKVRATRLHVLISVIPWTHDFVADPASLYAEHQRQIGEII